MHSGEIIDSKVELKIDFPNDSFFSSYLLMKGEFDALMIPIQINVALGKDALGVNSFNVGLNDSLRVSSSTFQNIFNDFLFQLPPNIFQVPFNFKLLNTLNDSSVITNGFQTLAKSLTSYFTFFERKINTGSTLDYILKSELYCMPNITQNFLPINLTINNNNGQCNITNMNTEDSTQYFLSIKNQLLQCLPELDDLINFYFEPQSSNCARIYFQEKIPGKKFILFQLFFLVFIKFY